MTDFHSHILPAVDDGSKSVEESCQMLKMLLQQGVNTVVATPHFYADESTVEDFLTKREKAFKKLKEADLSPCPEIICGAEVAYYWGISKMEGLEKLCVEGTKLLLLEMPMEKWSTNVISELLQMAASGKVALVLAHIERYIKYQDKKLWTDLVNSGILMQVNASFFLNFGTKRKALSMLKNGQIQLIGSDCHGAEWRPPKMDRAVQVIEKHFGIEFIHQMNRYGYSLLG